MHATSKKMVDVPMQRGMELEKFAKMGPQTLAFAVLPLAPHFIGTDGPTVSFTGSGKFTSGQCLQS